MAENVDLCMVYCSSVACENVMVEKYPPPQKKKTPEK